MGLIQHFKFRFFSTAFNICYPSGFLNFDRILSYYVNIEYTLNLYQLLDKSIRYLTSKPTTQHSVGQKTGKMAK